MSEVPLFVVLRRLQRDRLSGTLSVFRGDQVRQLFLERGELRAARSSREDHRVGATLVRWGYITQQDLRDALEIQQKTRQRIDQILAETGLVTRAVIDDEARRQMEQIIFSTLAWPDGSFHFEPNTGLAELDVAVSFSADAIVEGIRRIPESEQFVELLGDLKSVPRLTKDPMSSISFRLLKNAVDLLEQIDGNTSFEGLLKGASTSHSATAKILYSLMFAGLVETQAPVQKPDAPTAEVAGAIASVLFGEDTNPIGRTPAAEVEGAVAKEALGGDTNPIGRDTTAEPPESVRRPVVQPTFAGSGAAETSRQLVLDTYRQLDWLSHYDLLGVSRKATPNEISRAYDGRSRLFDPSLKAHPELVDLWQQLTVLNKWLRVAYGVLSNPATRAAYDKKIDEATLPAESETKKPG